MRCFFHSVDLDGQCSAAIVKFAHPECELIGINYGEQFPFDRITKFFNSVYDESKYDIMITFSFLPSYIWTVSLYTTKEEIDVGMIAKKYGGGGHKSAAGFQCTKLPFLGI